MSVYIKGMEMPTSCPCELIGNGYDLCCPFVGGIPARVKEYYECCQNDTRTSWCPLIPVPDHGRLIDADAFKKRMMQGAIDAREDALTDEIWLRILDAAKSLCLDIDEQPTIIPAEEGQ